VDKTRLGSCLGFISLCECDSSSFTSFPCSFLFWFTYDETLLHSRNKALKYVWSEWNHHRDSGGRIAICTRRRMQVKTCKSSKYSALHEYKKNGVVVSLRLTCFRIDFSCYKYPQFLYEFYLNLFLFLFHSHFLFYSNASVSYLKLRNIWKVNVEATKLARQSHNCTLSDGAS